MSHIHLPKWVPIFTADKEVDKSDLIVIASDGKDHYYFCPNKNRVLRLIMNRDSSLGVWYRLEQGEEEGQR